MVQELDASCFKNGLHAAYYVGAASDFGGPLPLHLTDRVDVQIRFFGEFGLFDAEQRARGFELVTRHKH
ncbi:hypothetical protein [Methylobacterium sp. E-066]|uniref:hypothetical protein n=1 Tax=Methylobacterium sp. E-066 TaxID=2836584 RepID=UPI0028C3FA24|nr:hypothetical protein [Methylobacterium sp. E-066]